MLRHWTTWLAWAFGVVALGAGIALPEGARAAEQRFITIGTGGVTGVYYPTGGAICRLVNRNRKEHGIRCSVESTDGSTYNVRNVRAGELDMGVIQSDVQYNSFKGLADFASQGAFRELRTLFAVHSEPVTVIARRDSGVTEFQQLKGKRLNIGNPGSGTRSTWDAIEQAIGWQRGDLRLGAELQSAETSLALCDNRIDAYFWLVGHPAALIKETLASCDSQLVNVRGSWVDRLVVDQPFYRKAVIPGGMYRSNPTDVQSFGVVATVVSSTRTPVDVVYQVVKAVFDNIDGFRNLHPAFANLKEAEMIAGGLSAPLHEGAVRYYRERGWQK